MNTVLCSDLSIILILTRQISVSSAQDMLPPLAGGCCMFSDPDSDFQSLTFFCSTHLSYKNWYLPGDNWLLNNRWEEIISMRNQLTFVEMVTW